ncbi:MAG: fasciclin domain-containing protein [Methanomicrobiaceae archaeon]|nr:fasciclin domain-containing protein [Methanomicrobiaceae archaeon]
MVFGIVVLVAAVLIAGCAQPSPEPTPSPTPTTTPSPTATPAQKNLVETAVDAGTFTTLVAAVQAADLADTLSGEGPFTVFAPTDDAFDALPEGTIDELLAEPEGQLKEILLYHVISGRLTAADVVDRTDLMTLLGKRLRIDTTDGVMVDGAEVVTTDIECSNGVIHVIDAVMMPKPNIVETAVADDRFETLVAAVIAADLAETLSDETVDFTVFAPTDDAFDALPEGTLDALLMEPGGELTDILLYHVVSGRLMASDVAAADALETLEGSMLDVTVMGEDVEVDGATVVIVDIECSNGVIHVIDAVMMPPEA